MTKKKKASEIWNILIYPSNDVYNNLNYYSECLMEIFKYDKVISEKILVETFTEGKSLVTSVDSKEKAVKIRDKLILFGIKSQIYLS